MVSETQNGSNGEFKIVVVGPRSVGKSALIVRFLTKRFINEYLENTEMRYERKIDIEGQVINMNIHDTSDNGMEVGTILQLCKSSNVIMFVYSITDRRTYEQTKEVIEKVLKITNENKIECPPFILIANKGDLSYVRKVSIVEGVELSTKLNKCKLYECSAREGWTKEITTATNNVLPATGRTYNYDTASSFSSSSSSPSSDECDSDDSNTTKKSSRRSRFMNRLRQQKKKSESAGLNATSLGGSVQSIPRSPPNVEDVDSALPFVSMCRLTSSRRPKSPSNFLRTSLRKIYSHLPHNNNNHSSNNSNNSNTIKPQFRFSY